MGSPGQLPTTLITVEILYHSYILGPLHVPARSHSNLSVQDERTGAQRGQVTWPHR